jgi:hypothetical protein
MKRISVLVMLLVGLAAVNVPAALAAPEGPNWGAEVNPGQCEKSGSPIINVTQKVINDVDSGENGYWAFDSFTRHIQLWESPNDGEYCAVVQYAGKFDAQEGQNSPGQPSETLDGNEDGAFQGGYRATIVGDLIDNPDWPTRGSVGTFDYQCDLSANCPGYVNWVDEYFVSSIFSYDWWGWTYRAGKHGTWFNTVDENSGNIS